MSTSEFSPELAGTIETRFPTIIAAPFAALQGELRSVQPNHHAVFSRVLDLFELSVAFVGLLSLADLIARRRERPASLQRLLRDQLCGPRGMSTGSWWELTRECLRVARTADDDSFSAEVSRVYFRNARDLTDLGRRL